MATKTERQYTIGIDIGGTNIKSVLFQRRKSRNGLFFGHAEDSLEHLIIMLLALIERFPKKLEQDKVRISGVGLGVPGVLIR